MGSRYLVDLADVCRAAGLDTVEVGAGPGQTGTAWQRRARGSGGYGSGAPSHVMVHHTASGAGSDGWGDANYCTFTDDDAPLCNLYLSRAGRVWVCAAGATNTNGSGVDPCGWVAADSMNTAAVGVEAGNNGTGERWPPAQLDAYAVLVAAVCAAYAIPVGRVHGHAEYAPTRKVDPAGPDRYAPGPATWNMATFRADVADVAGGAGPTPLPPDLGGADVEKWCVRDVDGWPWVTDFASYATSITEDQAARGRDLRGYIVDPATGGPYPVDQQDTDLLHRLAGR